MDRIKIGLMIITCALTSALLYLAISNLNTASDEYVAAKNSSRMVEQHIEEERQRRQIEKKSNAREAIQQGYKVFIDGVEVDAEHISLNNYSNIDIDENKREIYLSN